MGNAIVTQAVADTLNLTIHIIESNSGFASVTNSSAVTSEPDTTAITIGHLDEAHYMPQLFNSMNLAFNVICNNQPPQLAMGRCRTANNNETIAVAKEQSRKSYLKEYMATRRRKNEFRNKQNRSLQAKRSELSLIHI